MYSEETISRTTHTFESVLCLQLKNYCTNYDLGNYFLAWQELKTMVNLLHPKDTEDLRNNGILKIESQIARVQRSQNYDPLVANANQRYSVNRILSRELEPLFLKVINILHTKRYLSRSSQRLGAADFKELEDNES